MSKLSKIWILLAVVVITATVVYFLKPVAQDPAYHRFADRRSWIGIPNAWNVVSNVFFVLVGIWGYLELFRHQLDLGVRVIYGVLFAGIFLTGFGSAYYHWQPNSDRLIWDRIPMTVVFMSLLTATVSEWVDRRAGAWLLWPLVGLGIGSVLWWHHTEDLGQGDLRLYGWVQFFPMVCIPLILILFGKRGRYLGATVLAWAVAWYAMSKGFEFYDVNIFAWTRFISGHSLKHLTAAVATGYLVTMFRVKYAGNGDNNL
jgi:hypothetical protein